jgi:hypothetical protein
MAIFTLKRMPVGGAPLAPTGAIFRPPVYGPPAPTQSTASLPIAGLKYKTFLDSRASTRPLAIQFAKLTKNADLLKRLTAPAPTAAPAVTPAASAPAAPGAGPAAAPAGPALPADPSLAGTYPTPNTVGTGSTPIPQPGKLPTLDINTLYGPAERSIANQRAAALAAQNRAFQDNLAFEQYIQGATQQGNAALAGTQGQLSSAAATSRQQSIDNVTNALGQMNLAGGGSADLARLAGSTAASESNPLLQAGQSAQNAVPDVVGQAALRYAQDQTQVAGAQGRVMNDAATRATQAALADTAKQETALQTEKAGAGVQSYGNQLNYIVQAGQLDALNAFNSGKLTQEQYATQSKLYANLAKVKTARDVANVKAQTAAEVEAGRMTRADAANVNKIAVANIHETGATNRTLLSAAAKAKVANSNYGAAAVKLTDNILRNQTKSVDAQNRMERGQTVTQVATALKNSYVVNQSSPMTYSQAYDILSGIPKAGPEALKDAKFVAWMKTQFPGG